MNARLASIIVILATCAAACPSFAQNIPDRIKILEAKVAKLEARIAELEKIIVVAPPVPSPADPLELPAIKSPPVIQKQWTVAELEKKLPGMKKADVKEMLGPPDETMSGATGVWMYYKLRILNPDTGKDRNSLFINFYGETVYIVTIN